ncbi:MAG TPA: hypothetical protein VGZ02_10560 [Candidatus Baltobacteraceae bacterium]|nr:hypothetical protein [Candidatus Baltobacteraceae bacterium]
MRRLDDFVAALRRDFAQAAHYRSMGDVLLCDGLTVSEVAEFLAETFDDIRRAKGFKDCDGIDWEAAWCFAQAQKRGGSRARRIVAEPTRDDEAPVIVDDLSADVSAVRIWGVQTTAASRSTQAA